MFLTRIELVADASDNPEFWREVTRPDSAHHAIWRLFRQSPEQTRDFLFRQDYGGLRNGGRVCFYVLSRKPPHGDGGGLWRIEGPKRFAPKLLEGDHLRFKLRASPTVKKKPGTEGAQGKRCDVVMDARKKHPPGEPLFDAALSVQLEGERWLLRQAAAAGFEIARGPAGVVDDGGLVEESEQSALRVDGYRQHRLQRREGAAIRFSTLDFEGVLTVRDPTRFLAKVTLGFGPQKAFGCGLMLLRRA